MTFSEKAFTLVELLIVIAIIGILASVILSRLQNATEEGLETKTISELTVVGKRAAIEESKSLTYDVVCGSNGFTQATSIAEQIAAIELFTGDTVTCNSQTQEYAVSVPINTTEHWCVDSNGVRKKIPNALAISPAEYACP
ncbi:type II secretion system protein [Candidatus Nomurabacteria bacterium]|nr:type II secretion system protein [Candidatus Kaiserbacteria bacterium]MCB9814904.1 type II secretion system protein [Candidatus Nomurabacteria bacterium]